MPVHWTTRFLVIYSGLLTVLFVVGAYLVFDHGGPMASFDRIRVHRIDIVEPDGTPRLILSNRASYPGSLFHGTETPRPDRRDSAGMLMMNDEGTEDGGFIWGGLSKDGKPMSFSHLSFDQYEQDQTLNLEASFQNGEHFTAIRLNDVPDVPITPGLISEYDTLLALPAGEKKQRAMTAFAQRHPASHRRAALERLEDNSVALTLSDTEGRPRLRLKVANDGKPLVEFLDEAGKVTKTVSPTSQP
jgi:hypothetical protein